MSLLIKGVDAPRNCDKCIADDIANIFSELCPLKSFRDANHYSRPIECPLYDIEPPCFVLYVGEEIPREPKYSFIGERKESEV